MHSWLCLNDGVWCGAVRCGVVRCGVVRCGALWRGAMGRGAMGRGAMGRGAMGDLVQAGNLGRTAHTGYPTDVPYVTATTTGTATAIATRLKVLDTLDKDGNSIPVPGGEYLAKLVSHDVFSIGGGGGMHASGPGSAERLRVGGGGNSAAAAPTAPRGSWTMDRIITPADIDDFGYIKTTKIIQYMEAARFSADQEQQRAYRRDVESIVVENLGPVDVGGMFRLAIWERAMPRAAVDGGSGEDGGGEDGGGERRLEFEIWRQPGTGALVCRGEWFVGNPVHVAAPAPAPARGAAAGQLWPIIPQSSKL